MANILQNQDLLITKKRKLILKSLREKLNRFFMRKKYGDREKVVKSYLKLTEPNAKEPSQEIVNRFSGRIDIAQPEMVIFKFFKAIMNEKLIGREGVSIATEEYEKVFGVGTWQKLQSTSTLMPARDMAYTVDYFWKFHPPVWLLRWLRGELADEKRGNLRYYFKWHCGKSICTN